MHRSQRMGEAGVGGPGKGQLSKSELLDVAQALEERVVDDRLLVLAGGNRAMDGIADSHCHTA